MSEFGWVKLFLVICFCFLVKYHRRLCFCFSLTVMRTTHGLVVYIWHVVVHVDFGVDVTAGGGGGMVEF